jgi:hypothetical protein
MIRPDYQPLEKVLQNRLFEIPNYQRAYSWRIEQINDLHNDITNLKKQPNDRHHFMATIVCLATQRIEEIVTDEFKVLQIVDGQQRLTTLIIFLKAIELSLDRSNETQKREADKIKELLVKDDGRLILLQTNHDSSSIFRNFLVNGTIPQKENLKTNAEVRLFDSFNHSLKFVENWKKAEDVLALLKLVKNRLGFIFYELEDEGSVYSTFEVLNSRGLPVDWLDKCKSTLMGIAFEKLGNAIRDHHISQLHQIWSDIYRTIGVNEIQGHEILRFAATLHKAKQEGSESYLSKAISAEDALDYFRNFCNSNPTITIDVTDWISCVTRELRKLYDNPRLKAVTDILHARLLAVSILLLPENNMNVQLKNKLLEQWENVTFRIFGLFRNQNGKTNDSRLKVGDYTRLACKITDTYKKYNETDQLFYFIMYSLIELGKDYSIDTVVDSLKGKDCYNDWSDQLIYFMRRYEEYLCRKSNITFDESYWVKVWNKSPYRSIEHIMPEEATPPKWDVDSQSIDFSKNLHRLGNLIIYPIKDNILAGNRSFDSKKELYKKNKLNLMEEIIVKKDWNYKEIENRESFLLKFAREQWKDLSLEV